MTREEAAHIIELALQTRKDLWSVNGKTKPLIREFIESLTLGEWTIEFTATSCIIGNYSQRLLHDKMGAYTYKQDGLARHMAVNDTHDFHHLVRLRSAEVTNDA